MNMSTRKQPRHWRDSESDPPPAAQLAVQTTFRQMDSSPAVTARVEAEARKLLRYFDRITHCHVVILAPHRHHRRGRHYTVHIELGVPGDLLVINHDPSVHPKMETGRPGKRSELQAAHNDIYVVLRETFDSARRRLEDYARRLRGDVKHHPASDVA